jgi:hypothetical protein
VAGYLTFAQAGVANSDVVDYAIKDGNNSEIGTGTYTSSGTTLTRSVTKSTNSNSPLNLSGAAEVFITPRAETLITSIKKQIFTAGGTYTPSTGMLYCIVECLGAGGGGGAIAGTAGDLRYAGGGGAGQHSFKLLTAAQVGASQGVAVGALGAGGVAGATNGGTGGSTFFGSLCSAAGGGGGQTTAAGAAGFGGGGGSGGTGDIASVGAPGGPGMFSSIFTVQLASGQGGSTLYGSGGRGVAGNNSISLAATGYGAGGGGAAVLAAIGNIAGGNGSPGIVIITEFCNGNG